MTPADPWRPRYHYTAARNWINDPNGLVWFDGEYHLFYQHNPFGNEWGHMSWGHAVSADLVHWQELPVALPEDERVSIYSGSVVVDERRSAGFGESDAPPPLVAVYTGCRRRPEGGQAQELAFSTDRGRTWTKHAGNPVLDLGLRDFRDPKVFWHAPSARWVMAVVVPDDRRVQFHGSSDLKRWTKLGEFGAPFEGEGIWECPDLIPLQVPGEGTRWLFKVDVFGGHPSGGTGARIFFGDFDGARFTPEPEPQPQWADFGADFYAALSWANLQARPAAQAAPGEEAIWIAWMNCHRYARALPTAPWRGAMTVPRALSARRIDGRLRLLQQPVAALQALRGPAWELPACEVGEGGCTLSAPAGFDATAFELEFAIEATTADACALVLRAGQGSGAGAQATRVGYDARRGTVFVDRSRAGFAPPGDPLFAGRREAPCPVPAPGAPLRLRVFVDACSVEVFVGEGELTLTEQILPDAHSLGLRWESPGGTTRLLAGRAYPIRRYNAEQCRASAL